MSPELRAVAASSLEWKLTSRAAFGLETASDLQRIICRIADGAPLGGLGMSPLVSSRVGDTAQIDRVKPSQMYLLSGIRTAKSLIAACAAVHMALTCDVYALRPGEVPRVSVVSIQKDLADVIMGHIVGSVGASTWLRQFVIGEPEPGTLTLRHPSGRPVEIKVIAGARAGATLVARWSAGAIFDEWPRMIGGNDGVINFDDQKNAVIHRMLPGCQLWGIGSPWAPFGPAFELHAEAFGDPTPERVVIRAPAYEMNPVHWTAKRVAKARKDDPRAAVTDIDAEFADVDEALYTEAMITLAQSASSDTGWDERLSYVATMDPATRGNGWTFAITTLDESKIRVVRAREWVGSPGEPLDPGTVLDDIAKELAEYKLSQVHSDQAMGDALVKLAKERGVTLHQWTMADKDRTRRYLDIRTQMELGNVELPAGERVMSSDLKRVRKIVTQAGVSIKLPLTSDGRHCDWAPTLMLGLGHYLPSSRPAKTAPKVDAETLRLRKQMLDRVRRREAW